MQAVGLGSVFEKKRREVTDRFAAADQNPSGRIDRDEAHPAHDTEVAAHAWMGAIYNLMIQWVYTGEPTSERIVGDLGAAVAAQRGV